MRGKILQPLNAFSPYLKTNPKQRNKTIHLKNIDNDTHTESGTKHKDAA